VVFGFTIAEDNIMAIQLLAKPETPDQLDPCR